MNIRRIPHALISAVLLLSLQPTNVFSADTSIPVNTSTTAKISSTERQLQRLKTEIKEMRSLLGRLSKQRSRAVRSLAALDQQIAEQSRALNAERETLRINRQEQQQRLTELAALQIEKKKAIEQLKLQLRSQYQTGPTSTLRLLLQQQNPRELDRLLKYHQYTISAQNEQLQTFNRIMLSVEQKQRALSETEALIVQRERSLIQKLDELNKLHDKRKEMLANIKRDEQRKRAKLGSFKKDQKELAAVLELLKLQAAREKLANQSFSAQKGRLNWPVATKHRWKKNRYEKYKKGIVIPTEQLAQVRAVYDGKVVFSDWLRGYGLMVIIQHSEEYLSLYAYNASIEKEVGDRVKTGEVIALSGNTGQDATADSRLSTDSAKATGEASLYFEIRKSGNPINPTLWLTKKQSK